jgi:hypothetical protein
MQLAGESFTTKKALTERLRGILNAHADNQTVSPLSQDFEVLMALFRHHPQREAKYGVGVESVLIRREPQFGTRGFWLRRNDGSVVDISYLACMNGDTPELDAKAAFRWAVKGQVLDARAAACVAGKFTCPVTGELTQMDEAEVHHSGPSFDEILKDFLRVEGLRLEAIRTKGATHSELVDEEIARRWSDFHRRMASLVVVSHEGHRRLGAAKP